MRKAKSELTKEYETAKANLERDMKTIEDAMLGTLLQNKVKSMSSDAGTMYRETKRAFNCVDWDGFYAWVVEDPARLACLEKRVAKSAVMAFERDNDDELPPGITVYEETVVRVRVGNDSD